MTNAASIKDKLRRQSKEDGIPFQSKLTCYGLERTICRIAKSPYSEKFTLKGGIFLYALYDKMYLRSTSDIDLLAERISNSADEMKETFSEVFTIECDDALRFDLNTLEVKNITEFKEYHGVNISIMGYLDRTRVKVSIDIGFGDVVYPERVKMKFPTLLKMEEPEIYAYSIYSVIAEKFEAAVSRGYTNGRYKDFFDICNIAGTHTLDGNKLKHAIIETLGIRNTSLDDVVIFEDGFTDDKSRQARWSSFIKGNSIYEKTEFASTMEVVKALLLPVVDSIRKGSDFLLFWDKDEKAWK